MLEARNYLQRDPRIVRVSAPDDTMPRDDRWSSSAPRQCSCGVAIGAWFDIKVPFSPYPSRLTTLSL